MSERVEVKGTDVDLRQDGVVRISSPSLVNGLIKAQQETVTLVNNSVGPLDIQKVVFDHQGKIVVADDAFFNGLKQKIDAMAKADLVKNIVCGAGC